MYDGNYEERHAFARQAIGSGSNISLIPFTKCLGLDHLRALFRDIIKNKGEGIMLYHPTTKYTSGRTNSVLKVKEFEEDVKFIKVNPNSYAFICEHYVIHYLLNLFILDSLIFRKNGVQCIVKCTAWDYSYPPPTGTVLTVKHNGFYNSSQKLKYPFLLKIRTDGNWNY
eukprot:TRINITY_DN3525_c2_g1_i2.p1 TRINITY_DN3525_c2_g1~~TRINITY_DN3525_c2_g1_i2.p1  ORF type:complete len:169 (-),score=26.30 TRINITY_DN3525_c2_g1_i2:101-607(-)